MKIICIGRNYAQHAAELKNEVPSEPVVFLKPDTALLKDRDFYIPTFSKDIHHELELVIRISKNGKFIEEKFASKYYQEIGLGIDFTARDVQEECKKKGLPWEKAKAFDNSAPLGSFIPVDELKDRNNIRFTLLKNGQVQQEGDSSLMLFPFEKIISYVSRYFTLKTGDLIFTGTPAGVSAVNQGDVLEGLLEGKKLLEIKIR